MALRRDDGCQVGASRDTLPEDRIERLEADDLHAERGSRWFDVVLLTRVYDAHDVVVHAAGQTSQRIGNGRGADHHESARRHEGLDVDVDGPFGDARHRNHDLFGRRPGGLARVRPNRHQARAPVPQRFERLLPDDLARARAADESFHAAVGVHDRAVAEMRRYGRATRDDRRDRERLPFPPQRHDLLEDVHDSGGELLADVGKGLLDQLLRLRIEHAAANGGDRPTGNRLPAPFEERRAVAGIHHVGTCSQVHGAAESSAGDLHVDALP
jgi:hypothetical protein